MALPSLMIHISLVTLVFNLVLPLTVSFTHQATTPVEHPGYGKGTHQATAPVEQSGYRKEIEFTVYLIDILYGPNRTSVPVAGIQGQFWSFSTFGTIPVFDLIVVAEPSLYARQVGRVRGLAAVVSRDGRYNFATSSFVFSDYNGSTLETQGTLDRVSGQPSEMPSWEVLDSSGAPMEFIFFNWLSELLLRVTFRFLIPI